MKIHSDRTTETGNLLVGCCWIKVCFLCIISLLLEKNLIKLILTRTQIQGLFAKVLLFYCKPYSDWDACQCYAPKILFRHTIGFASPFGNTEYVGFPNTMWTSEALKIFKILEFCLNILRPEPGNETHGRLHLAPSQRNASFEQNQVQ